MVEKIIENRLTTDNSNQEYLVKWKGFANPTWVLHSDFHDHGPIRVYWKRLGKQPDNHKAFLDKSVAGISTIENNLENESDREYTEKVIETAENSTTEILRRGANNADARTSGVNVAGDTDKENVSNEATGIPGKQVTFHLSENAVGQAMEISSNVTNSNRIAIRKRLDDDSLPSTLQSDLASHWELPDRKRRRTAVSYKE